MTIGSIPKKGGDQVEEATHPYSRTYVRREPNNLGTPMNYEVDQNREERDEARAKSAPGVRKQILIMAIALPDELSMTITKQHGPTTP